MHRSGCVFLLVSLCSLVAGCDKLWPTATAQDKQVARHAMPISEVSLMVRSGYDQKKIIAEIEQRHVPEAIDGKTEENLVRFGAKPALIAALKSNANVLTTMQKQAFDELSATKRESATARAPVVRARSIRRQPDEDERQTVALPENSVNVPNAETPEEAYWKAEAEYRTKKKQLESKIASEQGSIIWKRAHGYHQSQLASAEDLLHQHEDELKNLKTPMR
jgi:hypothetical protein